MFFELRKRWERWKMEKEDKKEIRGKWCEKKRKIQIKRERKILESKIKRKKKRELIMTKCIQEGNFN